MIAALGGRLQNEKPNALPRLHVLSPVPVERLPSYEGPTWLDEAIIANWRPDPTLPGAAAELRTAIVARADWLAGRLLVTIQESDSVTPSPEMMMSLRKMQTERLTGSLSKQLNSEFMPSEPGRRVTGVYDRSINTPTGKVAVIRRQDTFTLAPWKPALEPLRGLQVTGNIGPNRVSWTLDRGRKGQQVRWRPTCGPPRYPPLRCRSRRPCTTRCIRHAIPMMTTAMTFLIMRSTSTPRTRRTHTRQGISAGRSPSARS